MFFVPVPSFRFLRSRSFVPVPSFRFLRSGSFVPVPSFRFLRSGSFSRVSVEGKGTVEGFQPCQIPTMPAWLECRHGRTWIYVARGGQPETLVVARGGSIGPWPGTQGPWSPGVLGPIVQGLWSPGGVPGPWSPGVPRSKDSGALASRDPGALESWCPGTQRP